VVVSLTDPASQTSVGESFNSVGGCTNYAQTFTIATTNYTLQAISIYAGGGSGTGTNLSLHLFDLGTQTAPNPQTYTAGTDLFNSGNGLTIAYAVQTVGVLEFDFNGSDQVTLQSGHQYAFEIDGVNNTTPVAWERTTAATYAGGAAYRNLSWINGNGNMRAFSLAVYATGSTNTNTTTAIFFGPSGVILHGFSAPSSGVNPDGANPAADLVLSGGLLYGTTLNGGSAGAGTAFFINLNGTNFDAFDSFAGPPNAANPWGDLTIAPNTFFGTSTAGGNNSTGNVFEGNTNGSPSSIRNFAVVSADEATNSGGASPSGLLALSGNMLYGTTVAGGTAANGTVFSSSTNGSTFLDLHDFTGLDSNTGTNTDGALPDGGVVLAGSMLYGTASGGGAGGAGTVFSINVSGNNFTTLYSFTSLDPLAATNADGAFPSSGLILSNGILYGTTIAGGSGGKGVVFSIGTNGLGFTVLHVFSATDPVTGTNLDGASPSAVLALSGGNLYGTASAGGTGANGTVFSVGTNGVTFQTIHSFTAMDPITGTNTDGALPVAGVLPLGNTLFGTTFSGGPGGVGTVFTLAIPNPAAMITNIVSSINGTVILYFLGGPSSTNIIQATASLAPPVVWQNVSTNVADGSGAWQFTDNKNTSVTRFYRSYVLQ
jgi:uncharacterized repeat protein (TIGR03803 family)